MNSEHGRCAHEACDCTLDPGIEYCSAYCANVDVHESDPAACSCGHAICLRGQQVPKAEEETVTSIGGGPGRGGGSE